MIEDGQAPAHSSLILAGFVPVVPPQILRKRSA